MCTDSTPMHCSRVQGKIISLLISVAKQAHSMIVPLQLHLWRKARNAAQPAAVIKQVEAGTGRASGQQSIASFTDSNFLRSTLGFCSGCYALVSS